MVEFYQTDGSTPACVNMLMPYSGIHGSKEIIPKCSDQVDDDMGDLGLARSTTI